MKQIFSPVFRRIFLQFVVLLGFYFISRCMFTVINLEHFEGLDWKHFFSACFFALRYDISAILAVNSIYILLWFFPLPVWKLPRWESFTQLVFVITNSFAFLFEISDWAYFPYNFKRSTADVLNMISRKGDFWSLLPRFFIDYSYVPISAILFIWFLIWCNKRIRRVTPLNANAKYNVLIAFAQTIALTIVAGLCMIGIRGGLQYVPIGTRNAVQVTDPRYTPIVINTPFSIINTFQNDELQPAMYFPDSELSKYINTRKQYRHHSFKKKNVVLLIVESFSKEFTKIGGGG